MNTEPIPPDLTAETRQAWHFLPGLYAAGPDPAGWAWTSTERWRGESVVVVDHRVADLRPLKALGAHVHRSPVPDVKRPDPVRHLRAVVTSIVLLADSGGRVIIVGDEWPVAAVVLAVLMGHGYSLADAYEAYTLRRTGRELPPHWRPLVEAYARRYPQVSVQPRQAGNDVFRPAALPALAPVGLRPATLLALAPASHWR